MNDDTIVSRSGGMIEAEIDGELVGLHIDKGDCYGFNKTATRIWALIEQPRSVREICAALTADFEVSNEECAAQVRDLLGELESEGLVTLAPPSGAAA